MVSICLFRIGLEADGRDWESLSLAPFNQLALLVLSDAYRQAVGEGCAVRLPGGNGPGKACC